MLLLAHSTISENEIEFKKIERGQMMKILLFLAIVIIAILIYCLYEFHKEIEDYKEHSNYLIEKLSNYNKILIRIKEIANSAKSQNCSMAYDNYNRIIVVAEENKILDMEQQSHI